MKDKSFYRKLIVVDFDDTLALHPTNDTSNIHLAKPNVELIQLLNELYDDGYFIMILTSRGHFSCDSRDEAERKYRPVIEGWLRKHQVKYHELSFNKPYALVYVDDKAVRPNELSRLRSLLKGGRS